MPQSGPGSTAAAAAVGGRALPSLNVAVTESSQHLVAVNTRKAALRRKKSKKRLLRERRRRIIFIVLVAVVTALAVALLCVCVVWPPKKIAEPEEVCRTKECLASAYRIVKAMDSNTNPCEDFYTFACGNWVHEHPLYGDELEASRFTEARHSLALEIQDILEANNSPSDPLPVKQARELYNSCMAIDHLESLSVKPMIDTLEMLGLPGKLPDEDSVRNFNLTRTMALIQYHLTIDKIIFSLGVGLDPHNETRRLLLVTPPRISMKRQNAKREKQETEEDQGEENGKKSEETREEEEREDEEMEFIVGPGPQYYATKEERPLKELVRREILYRARMMQLFELERGGSEEVNITKFHVAAIKTLLLELKLYQEISSKPTSSDVQPSTLQRDAVTALETNNLTETSNMIDWELFLNIMFEDVDGADHSKDRILVLDRSYFKKIALLLAKTKTETIHRRNV
ncbi:endothelin-converting enzyme 1-like [Periplaneta americana]|uniref:endothelin-converting enzyme 1-like n=1 Tax=Periplaneta americana TaxID=6978 RepID=UPI0037E7D3F1